MKLLMCLECQDVFKLRLNKERICLCGKCGGKYIDELNAVYWGRSILIGFDNVSLHLAIMNRPKEGLGKEFNAFVIPENCDTIKRNYKK
jgi:hypothetical protein